MFTLLSIIHLMALDIDVPPPKEPDPIIYIDRFFEESYRTPHATNVLYPFLIIPEDQSDFIAIQYQLTNRYHQFNSMYATTDDVVIRVSTFFDYEEAVDIAKSYGRTIGQIPPLIRYTLRTLTLHPGDGHPSSGEHTESYTELRINAWGVKEENLIHDFVHASLNDKDGLLDKQEWLRAVALDGFAPSLYAAEHPWDEDVPESIIPYLVARWRPERFDSSLVDFYEKNMAHRFAVLDKLNWQFNK